MSHPVHHIHKRKRAQKKHEPYPHPEAFKRFMDHTVYVVGIIGPMMGSLQAYKIWGSQTAAGVSLAAYAFYVFNDVVWFTYGMIHKEKPIIIMYSLWFIINLITVAGILTYG